MSLKLCVITGFKHKPFYVVRTTLNVTEQFNQLDDTIAAELLLAITRGINGVPTFSESREKEYEFLNMLSTELTA